MPKSSRVTLSKRVREVERLIVAGAESADIERLAASQDWKVSRRQIQRYITRAYERLAKAAKRDRRQLLGRHVTQRRALYAHSLKAQDIRTALSVLRDEAALQGLYPGPGEGPAKRDDMRLYPTEEESPLSRMERIRRFLKAHYAKDETELDVIDQLSPRLFYEAADTLVPIIVLHELAQRHVVEQLALAVTYYRGLAMLCDADDERLEARLWPVLRLLEYRMRIEADAWRTFTQEIGVDADLLLAVTPGADVLTSLVPMLSCGSTDDLAARIGESVDDLPTANSMRNRFLALWERALEYD